MRISILFLLLAFSSGSYTQLSLKKGEWTKRKFGTVHLGLLVSDSNSVFTINDRNLGSPIVSEYDISSLNFKNDISLKTNSTAESSEKLTHVFTLNNVLFQVIEKSTVDDFILICVQKVESNDQNIQKICLDSLPKKKIKGEYDIIVNEEENAFVYVNQLPISNSNNQRIDLKVFNSNLNPIWEHSIDLTNKERQFILENWKLCKDYSVTFVGRPIVDLYKPKVEFIRSTQNNYYLFNYNFEIEKLIEIELSLHNKFIDQIDFMQSDSNCIVSGIFSIKNETQAHGIFSLGFDKQFRRKDHTIHHFSIDEISRFSFINSHEEKKKSANKKNYVNELLIRNFITLTNGEFVVLAEEFGKEWEEPLTSNRQEPDKSSSYLYYYQNIHVFWFEANGEIKSIRSIPKYQMARESFNKFNSYLAAKGQNELYIFFNDNPKNIDKNPSESKPSSSKKKMLVKYARLSSDGAINTIPLTSPSKRERVLVNLGAQLSDNNVYLLCQKGWRKKALIQIDLDD